VQAHPQGNFLQSAAWGRFKAHFGWVAARISLPAPRGGSPLLAQALFRRVPCSPFTLGYLPRGPLLDYQDEDALDTMVRTLDRLARRYRAISVTWELPAVEDDLLTARLLRHRFRPARPVQTRYTNIVDLDADPDGLLARMKPVWRRNIRRATRDGVRVRSAADGADFARWYALYEITARRDHFTIREAEYYRRFWQETRPTGDTVLLLAEHEDRLLAGILLHRFGREATYLYGASDNQGRNLMPNHILQWEAMLWARERGAKRYDLWGVAETDDPEEPLAGVTAFKAGFGGEVVRYAGAFDRVYHPVLHALVQRARAGGPG
jgi:lipid II:glycine glycyltransferase (peptidoglycan interpeptide bridge formation enzyme)